MTTPLTLTQRRIDQVRIGVEAQLVLVGAVLTKYSTPDILLAGVLATGLVSHCQ